MPGCVFAAACVVWLRRRSLLPSVAGVVLGSSAHAAVIDVVATDTAATNIAKIEAAAAGDEVVVGPGTYRFRLYLQRSGSADRPIIIRAKDRTNRPVWDLTGKVARDWPGSYTGGDAGRGIWQITGSYYDVSGIVLRGGTDGGTGDSSGVRLKSSEHVSFRDCLFERNDNGLQGAGTATLVEFSEFSQNGLPASTDMSHNLYIHGGDITVRYSYIHDVRRGQNFHIRANRSVFEYNWIARPMSYMGDMMPCTVDPCSGSQTMLLRGNVFINGAPLNDGQVFVMYNDVGAANVSFALTMVNNTFIGSGDGAPLVHFANDDPALNRKQTAELHNNVFYNVSAIGRANVPSMSNWELSGTNNWLSTGTAGTAGLSGTLVGADPGFTDRAASKLVPRAGSPLIGAANGGLPLLPDKEYYRDETLTMQWRARAAARDIGAFESTTSGPSFGPHPPAPGVPAAPSNLRVL